MSWRSGPLTSRPDARGPPQPLVPMTPKPPDDRSDELPPAEAARARRRDHDGAAAARSGMRTGLAKQFKQVLDAQVKRGRAAGPAGTAGTAGAARTAHAAGLADEESPSADPPEAGRRRPGRSPEKRDGTLPER